MVVLDPMRTVSQCDVWCYRWQEIHVFLSTYTLVLAAECTDSAYVWFILLWMVLSLDCTFWWWACYAETCRSEVTLLLYTVSARIWCIKWTLCRSQWLRVLRRRRSVAACLPGLSVRIPPVSWMSVVSVVCYQVEVSVTCWSFVQRSPTECGVCECDCESTTMGGPAPLGAVALW
jgi:hypothetical protein